MATENRQEFASGSPPDKEPPAYPFSGMAGRSVIKALVPASRPSRLFWAGLFMVLGGLVLVICPLLVGAALAAAQGLQGPSEMATGVLGLSACFTVVLLLPGVALMIAGRAKR